MFTTGPEGDDAEGGGQFDLRSVDNDDDGDLASTFSGSNNINGNGGGAYSSDGESGVTPGGGSSGNGDEASTSTGMTGSTNKTGFGSRASGGGIFNRAGISKTLAKREDRAIWCSKALMLLFLAVAAGAAAAATFLLFSKSQEESFETEVRIPPVCLSLSLSPRVCPFLFSFLVCLVRCLVCGVSVL